MKYKYLSSYTQNDYELVNTCLRQGGFWTKEERDIIKNLSKEYDDLKDSFIDWECVIYRGLDLNKVPPEFRFKFLGLQINSLFYDNAYMSFTPDLNVAERFARVNYEFSFPIIFSIRIDPKRYISRNIKDISKFNHYNERECLIKKGTFFDVIDYFTDEENGITYIELEENLEFV